MIFWGGGKTTKWEVNIILRYNGVCVCVWNWVNSKLWRLLIVTQETGQDGVVGV